MSTNTAARAWSPGLEPFFDPAQAGLALRAAGVDCDRAQAVYVRHKPGETTLIGYELENSANAAQGYLVWCVDRDRAHTIHAKAQTLRPQPSAAGLSVGMVGDRAVFYGFPNDARLRKLRWFVTGRKLKRSLEEIAPTRDRIRSGSTSTILKYKPERRLVARVDLEFGHAEPRSLLLRYTTGRCAPRLAGAAEALERVGVDTPAVVGSVLDGRVLLTEFRNGQDLRQVLVGSGPAPDPTRVAELIARMHRAPMDAPVGSAAMATPAPARLKLEAVLAGIVELVPDCRPDVDRLVSLLDRRPVWARPTGFVHGDLHLANIMWDRAGDTVMIIDLERSGQGPCEQDLGMLLGVAKGNQIRDRANLVDFVGQVIDGYSSLRPVDYDALRWFTAAGLVDQAALCARHLMADHAEQSARLIQAACAEIES